jgi:membrane protein involved in colicin uptake
MASKVGGQALEDAAEQAAKEAAEKAAKEAAEKAAKEAAERAAKEAAEKAAREAAEKTSKTTAMQFARANAGKIVAGLGLAGLLTYAGITGKSPDQAAQDVGKEGGKVAGTGAKSIVGGFTEGLGFENPFEVDTSKWMVYAGVGLGVYFMAQYFISQANSTNVTVTTAATAPAASTP